jgi:hypothetical protein
MVNVWPRYRVAMADTEGEGLDRTARLAMGNLA